MYSLIFSALAATAPASSPDEATQRFPEDVFVGGTVRGPYRTGTFEELWIDERRDETTTSDPSDKRHLMVQIWYPAEFSGSPERAPYVLHRGLYGAHTWHSADRVAAMPTNSVLKAPLVADPRVLPVLIYNPGGGSAHFTGTFITEFLASHGYVVVGIGHTDLTDIERFPDGYVYKRVNSPYLTDEESKRLSPEEGFREQIKRFSEQMMPIHVQDIRFALDQLQTWNATPGNRFYKRLDLEHVGTFGWSLGGALSLQASCDEPRIKAAVDLDGTIVADTGTQRPVLVMTVRPERPEEAHPDTPARAHEIGALDQARFWKWFARSDGDWYRVTLAHTYHGQFSDDSLFWPPAPNFMHPRLAHDIINTYTLEFFDKYLRGRKETPLLDGKSSYPDAALIRKPSN